jgi:hypothetical protein
VQLSFISGCTSDSLHCVSVGGDTAKIYSRPHSKSKWTIEQIPSPKYTQSGDTLCASGKSNYPNVIIYPEGVLCFVPVDEYRFRRSWDTINPRVFTKTITP